MKLVSWQKLVIGLALAAGCMLIGATIPMTNQALGEVRGGAPESPAFQQGTVPVLRDISATLRQMDGRLARMEALAQKMTAKAAISARVRSAEPAEDGSN
jgi:hypothetical protein